MTDEDSKFKKTNGNIAPITETIINVTINGSQVEIDFKNLIKADL